MVKLFNCCEVCGERFSTDYTFPLEKVCELCKIEEEGDVTMKMKKGLKLHSWEIASIFDVMSFVEEEGYFEVTDVELEVIDKLRAYLTEVEEEWSNLSEEEKEAYINMTHEERIAWSEKEE